MGLSTYVHERSNNARYVNESFFGVRLMYTVPILKEKKSESDIFNEMFDPVPATCLNNSFMNLTDLVLIFI